MLNKYMGKKQTKDLCLNFFDIPNTTQSSRPTKKWKVSLRTKKLTPSKRDQRRYYLQCDACS